MSPVSASARSMCDPRRLPRRAHNPIRLVLLWLLVSIAAGAAPGWSQTASPAGGVSLMAGDEEATVVGDQIQQVGGSSDLMIAVGNVEITRGQTRLLADRVELNRDTGQAVTQGKVVLTAHPEFDPRRLVAEARLVVDPRNVTRALGELPHVVRL
jgi:lipopolysaccharide transport LptD-like protein